MLLACEKDNSNNTACYICTYGIVTSIEGSNPTNVVRTIIYCDLTQEQIEQKIDDSTNKTQTIVNGKRKSVSTWMKCIKQ